MWRTHSCVPRRQSCRRLARVEDASRRVSTLHAKCVRHASPSARLYHIDFRAAARSFPAELVRRKPRNHSSGPARRGAHSSAQNPTPPERRNQIPRPHRTLFVLAFLSLALLFPFHASSQPATTAQPAPKYRDPKLTIDEPSRGSAID